MNTQAQAHLCAYLIVCVLVCVSVGAFKIVEENQLCQPEIRGILFWTCFLCTNNTNYKHKHKRVSRQTERALYLFFAISVFWIQKK